jgi:hypothetical protein
MGKNLKGVQNAKNKTRWDLTPLELEKDSINQITIGFKPKKES